MNKPSLIEIVQGILSDMDSDEVNSIGDTIESMQVANAVRQTYYGIVEEFDLQGEETAFQLEPVAGRPTHMSIPAGVFDVTQVRYDGRRIPFTWREDFLEASSHRSPTEDHITAVFDPSGLSINIWTNGPPSSWSTLDGGRTLVFDGYDLDVESNLQAHKTQCLGQRKRTLELDSDALVELPETLHQLLINEARELCFELYKDGAGRKLNEMSRRSRVRAKQRNNKVKTPPDTLPDYGRKRRG